MSVKDKVILNIQRNFLYMVRAQLEAVGRNNETLARVFERQAKAEGAALKHLQNGTLPDGTIDSRPITFTPRIGLNWYEDQAR